MTGYEIAALILAIFTFLYVFSLFAKIKEDNKWLNEHCESKISDEEYYELMKNIGGGKL